MLFSSIYRTFYPDQPAEFESEYSVEESIARLKACIEPEWAAGFTDAVSGLVSRDEVKIQKLPPFKRSYFAVFYGAFEEQDERVVLRGGYSAALLSRVLTTIMFVFTLIWTCIAIKDTIATVSLTPQIVISRPMELLFVLGGPGFFAFYCLILRFEWRRSQDDIETINQTIRKALSKPE